MKENKVRINRLSSSADTIHSDIFSIVCENFKKGNSSNFNSVSMKLHKQVNTQLSYIEKHCARKKGSPADLSTPSFRIYLWLRFLSRQDYFLDHLNAMHEFLNLVIVFDNKIRIDPNHFLIKINYSGYLYHRQTISNKTVLQINEAFISAPVNIKRTLITAALSRSASKKIKEIKSYTNHRDYQHMNRLISGAPIANRITCRGERYDLSVLFSKLNLEYFNKLLPQPRLIWSSKRAVRRLGYFHPEIFTIAINKKLDDKQVPRLLIEYVLYHEMLHQNIGIKTNNGRRYAHTSAFKEQEKRFRHYVEAENLIKLLY